jgi:hypothetical protein
VAEFLSDAWIEELDRAGAAVDTALDLRLDQVVTGVPGGDLRYRLTIDHGRLRVHRPSCAPDVDTDADVTLTTSFDTAVELATGRRNASDAFAAGLVHFRGDLTLLQAATATLGSLAEALVAVRRRTTFPRPAAAGASCDAGR